ncbi:MAG: cellulose biosynthesis cyclic di-GMP-binding regulatory protein BcsB, partial [Terracidiphilus sp.]
EQKAAAGGPGQGVPLAGDTVQAPDLALPPPRTRGDAPRWLPTARTAPLVNCSLHAPMQTDGSSPIPVYFHLPPDLFFGDTQSVPMRVNYRYEARAVAAGSALRIVVNGLLVSEIPLPPGTNVRTGKRVVRVPVANLRPFGNTVLFSFDFIPADLEAVQNGTGPALDGEIACDSSLDLHGLARWAPMPNLELFSNAGFPFTRSADLSETTVVLPTAPSPAEIGLFLQLMGHFGAQTGYPALRLSVALPNTVISPDRDYLIVGTVANQPAFQSLDALLPVTLTAKGIAVKPRSGWQAHVSALETAGLNWWARLRGQPVVEVDPGNPRRIPEALIEEVQSPVSPQRSIVVVVLRQDSSADGFAGALIEQSQSHVITGSAALLLDSGFASYPLAGSTYHVGDLSWLALLREWFVRNYLLLLLGVALLMLVLGSWVREWLEWRAGQRLKLAQTADTEE